MAMTRVLEMFAMFATFAKFIKFITFAATDWMVVTWGTPLLCSH